MSFNFSFGQTSLTVNYLNEDDFTFENVTSNSDVWISDNLEGNAKITLNASNGVFKIDSLPTDCPYLHIKDQNGEMHTQKLCIGLKRQKDWKVYIGSSNCLYHFESYQPEPFIPVYDKIYLTFVSEAEDFKYKLDSLGLSKDGPLRDVYQFNSAKRRVIFKELSKRKEVYTIAPIHFYGKTRSWILQYFYSNIDILFLNELTVQEIELLSKDLGINKIQKSKLSYSTWKNYKSGVPYQIELKKEVVIDYSFLKKLEKLLLENENLLVVKTHTSLYSKND